MTNCNEADEQVPAYHEAASNCEKWGCRTAAARPQPADSKSGELETRNSRKLPDGAMQSR